ncbi:hypothetical protein GYH30_014271 [Glycine max]|nr:hypothetical protein GYH30_014271 [Glycine max]
MYHCHLTTCVRGSLIKAVSCRMPFKFSSRVPIQAGDTSNLLNATTCTICFATICPNTNLWLKSTNCICISLGNFLKHATINHQVVPQTAVLSGNTLFPNSWFMLTSPNLSKAAWGALQKNNTQLMIPHTQELASFMIFKPCLMTYKNLKMPRKVFTLIVFNLFLIILGAFAIKYILSCSPKLGVLFLPSLFKQRGSVFSCTSNVTLSEVANTSLLFDARESSEIKKTKLVTLTGLKKESMHSSSEVYYPSTFALRAPSPALFFPRKMSMVKFGHGCEHIKD